MTRILLALALVLASSCGLPGAPAAGGECLQDVDQSECISETSLGVCSGGRWTSIECARCDNQQDVKCTHAVGDPCSDGEGYCVSSAEMLRCVGGKYAAAECSSCEQRDQLFVCL